MSKKISELSAVTSNTSADLLVIARGVHNYKITYADFVSALVVSTDLDTTLTAGNKTGEKYITSNDTFSKLGALNGTASVSYDNGAGSAGYLSIVAGSLTLSHTSKIIFTTPSFAGGKAIYLNGSKELTESTTTSTELGYVAGVTSAIQTQINNKQPLATNLTSLSGLTYASASFVKMTAAGTFALDTNTYMSSSAVIPINQGGTNTTSQTTNGVAFYNGTIITTGSQFKFDGTNVGIGATPDSLLTVAAQSTIVAPPTGTSLHFIGLDANSLRIALDTHNNAGAGGTAFLGRRSRGTASAPSAVQAGDTIISFNGVGYGTSQYGAVSTGLITIKGNELFTNIAMGTYVSIFTTPDGSVTAAEALRITGAGAINASQAAGVYQINGTTVISATALGSGVVSSSLTSFGASPTLITPLLGTPTSGVLTNCTGLPKASVVGYEGYTLVSTATSLSPVDATTYYFGVLAPAVATTANVSYLIIPKTGTIKRIDVIIINAGTLGSNETSTISFRLNNTTDTSISSAITTNAAIQAFTNSALSIAVTAGDTFELKWVTPTWATNPTTIRFTTTIYIE